MVEVTGCQFWTPYGGFAGERYSERLPMNLSNLTLIALGDNADWIES